MEDKPNGVPSTPSPEGTVQVEGKESKGKRAYNSPRTSKEVWRKVKARFEEGSYTSLKELSLEFGVNHGSLRQKVCNEKWNEKQIALDNKVSQVIENKVLKEVDRQTSYLSRLSARAYKYEQIIDASLEQAGAKDAQGVNVLDLEAIDVVTRSEQRLVEMQKVALRIAPLSQLDITSGGKDLGTSFVQAIAKLREAGAGAPKLTGPDLDKVLEAEVE